MTEFHIVDSSEQNTEIHKLFNQAAIAYCLDCCCYYAICSVTLVKCPAIVGHDHYHCFRHYDCLLYNTVFAYS